MKPKSFMLIAGSALKIKESLSQAGFVRDFVHQSTYRMELDTPSGVYVFQLPYEEQDGTIALYGETAFFEGISDTDVPETIQAAALERWHALRLRVASLSGKQTYSPDRGDRRPSGPVESRPVETARNGSMVQDFADMKRLAQDMQRMKTEQQLSEEGLVDDPIQHRLT
ncbi:hypothetical protein D7Z26_25120 [Cohnella endophytica]|uniref:Uncharacterized protein n=1 Tax=Cohnella endophytica TaxID=2419778 RepID=A0A494XE03_9BACL|nr:hypothetical protein [Cohnella endophytica]RKP45833.1 hypothetical protein D7Z26_25120 [Cohnella endophytica]